MKFVRRYFYIALLMWALVATYGLTLRYHLWHPLPIKYAYWLHAHSHAAFLGWLHSGFMIFLAWAFLPDFMQSKAFRRLYAFMQLMVAGMLISFPLQGYKAVSITLLSLFLLGTYVWAWYFFRKNRFRETYPLAYVLARSAIIFMLISSLSPWALGPVMVFLGKQSIWYNLDVYFYLHFQYNGWFFMGMLSLLAYLAEREGKLRLSGATVKKINRLLFAAVLLGYITNTLWTEPPYYFHALALVSVVLEAWGLWWMYRILKPHFHLFVRDAWERYLFRLILLGLAGKIVFQFMASCPYFSHLAYTIRDFIIGYLHWVFLGTYSVFLLYLMQREKVFSLRRWAFHVFFGGYALMLSLIFLRGTLIWLKTPVPQGMPAWIFWATAIMFTGILIIWYDAHRTLFGNRRSRS
ncbi:MAG: hypothetical protein GXO24_00535 [Chlorobi bacterium]|nr:hypothetical protein [Chlorobiota bacterium]